MPLESEISSALDVADAKLACYLASYSLHLVQIIRCFDFSKYVVLTMYIVY
jgi:hypothetical protein